MGFGRIRLLSERTAETDTDLFDAVLSIIGVANVVLCGTKRFFGTRRPAAEIALPKLAL